MLRRRQQRAFRRAALDKLTTRQLEDVVRYSNKAAGWLMVASGTFFIAAKGTWELHEAHERPARVFLLPVVRMPVLCAVNAMVRTRRGHDIMAGGREATTS